MSLPPLAERLRPSTLDSYIGQRHLVGPGGVIARMIETGNVGSFILWGPPGVGKTTLAQIIAASVEAPFFTLSAVTSGVREVREVLESDRYHDDVVMDEREAAYHGVHAVPFFVINGKYSISGAPDTEGLRQALLKLMAKEAEEQMASGMSCGPEGCKLR